MKGEKTTKRGPVRPSCTCTRGLRPLDPFSGWYLADQIKSVPADTEKNTEVWLGSVVLLARRMNRR